MPRPGGHVHQNAGLLGCQDRLDLKEAAGLHPLHAGVARRTGAAQEDSSDPKPVRIVCRLPPGQQWPGLGDTCIGLERWACWLSGPARSRGGGGPSEKATSQLGLAQVVAEADRVLEDNGTVKETKAVLRGWSSTWVGVARAVKVLSSGKAQKIYPGKWTLSGKKDELQQKLREFVEEAGLRALSEIRKRFSCDAGQSNQKGLGRGRRFVRTAGVCESSWCNWSARIPTGHRSRSRR